MTTTDVHEISENDITLTMVPDGANGLCLKLEQQDQLLEDNDKLLIQLPKGTDEVTIRIAPPSGGQLLEVSDDRPGAVPWVGCERNTGGLKSSWTATNASGEDGAGQVDPGQKIEVTASKDGVSASRILFTKVKQPIERPVLEEIEERPDRRSGSTSATPHTS